MADTNYQYSISNDFPNEIVEVAKLKYEIEQSSIASASIIYAHTSGDNCNIWFDGVLSSEDETSLDSIVAAHDGNPLTDIIEYDGYVSTNNGISFYTTPEIRELDLLIYRSTNDMVFKDISIGPYTLSQLYNGPNVYGLNYQIEKSLTRSSTTSDIFQDKVTLTTGTLTGTYRISWFCLLDNDVNLSKVRLYNNTDSLVVGDVQYFKPANKDVIMPHCGVDTITFSASSKVFKLQYCSDHLGHEIGIRDAKVEIWRVS